MNSAVESVGFDDREQSCLTVHAGKGTTMWSVKRWFDISVASFLLIPGLPMIGLLIVLVRLTSRGPGVYRQVRVGLNGKTFTMYKLRSMRVDAETKSGAVWSTGNGDNRVTPIGKLLRNLHLDELPQLFNVLKGEMSLVGPRPERPEITPVLEDSIPRYAERSNVSPGVTGLAQLNLPPDTDLDSVRKKLILDLEYIESRNLWFDLRILVCTFRSFLFIEGTWALRLFGLSQSVSDESLKEFYFADDEQVDEESGDHIVTPSASKSRAKSHHLLPVANSAAGGATGDPQKKNVEISAGAQTPELDSSISSYAVSPTDLPNHPR